MKDFDVWNEQQKILDTKNNRFLFKEGDVWWCAVGVNIGVEACGKGETFRRPVLVLKKMSHDSFIGIPFSTKNKIGSWFHALIVNEIPQTLLLSQMRIFSANRFQRRFAVLEKNEFSLIKEKVKRLLNLS